MPATVALRTAAAPRGAASWAAPVVAAYPSAQSAPAERCRTEAARPVPASSAVEAVAARAIRRSAGRPPWTSPRESAVTPRVWVARARAGAPAARQCADPAPSRTSRPRQAAMPSGAARVGFSTVS